MVPVTNMVNICLVGQSTYLDLVFRELNLSFLQNGVTERKILHLLTKEDIA